MSEDFPRSEQELSEDPHPEYTGAKSVPPAAARRGSWIALIVVLVLIAGAFGYAFHEHRAAVKLAAQNGVMSNSLAATQAQIDALSAKLNELSAAQAAKPAAAPAAAHRSPAKHVTARHRRADDPRWKELQSQLAEQGKQIDATRQDLSSTRTELTGSIARTHDELVALEKKGEKSYFEFDVDKNGQFQHNGPIAVRLKKANTKNDYADLELMVDDYKVSKKHVNIFEPVTFYAAENGQPVELVINSISKNHIHGYVSQPKYRGSELQAMSGNSATTTPSPAPQQRQKLELPKN